MDENETLAYALFHQILAMFLPEHTEFEVMPVDKLEGKIDWMGHKINVKAYRMFSRAKGHSSDMLWVDFQVGGK